MKQILTINGKPLSDFATYYDGSEWWEFKTLPIAPEETRDLYLKEV